MILSLLLAAAAAAQPAPAATAPAAPPTQAEQMAQFEQSLRQRGFSDAGVRAILAGAPQGAAQGHTLQTQGEAAVAELRAAAAANPVDVARVSADLRRLDDISAQLARVGTDATIRNLQVLSEPDRRLLLETMGLRGNPQAAPGAPPAPAPGR
jgi:membrane-bound lytic murein transglycosylase B